jgi:hypothetical protein
VCLLALCSIPGASPARASEHAASCACGYLHPSGGTVITVNNLAALQNAINSAAGKTTILVASGSYDMRTSPYAGYGIGIQVSRRDITIRSASGNPDDVIFDAGGMTDGVAKAFMISDYTTLLDSLRNITLADITIRNASNHLISVQGEFHSRNLMIHNVHLVNAGQQLIKVNPASSSNPTPVTNGTVACSRIEYETFLVGGWYTQGVDIHAGDHWTIRDNVIRNIRADPATGTMGGPAILVWSNSAGTIVERNTIIDCDRGITFGDWSHNGMPYLDETGGIIRDNVIRGYMEANPEGTLGSYESISLSNAAEVTVGNNTMYAPGFTNRGIDLVGPAVRMNTFVNNITDKEITMRAGAVGAENTFTSNMEHAGASNYLDAPGGDLHLAAGSQAVDAGSFFDGICADMDCEVVADGEPDIGADEVDGTAYTGEPCDALTAVHEYAAPGIVLAASRPNPFGPDATIEFMLDSPGEITVEIHDLQGRRVRTLVAREPMSSGSHRLTWDGKDESGRAGASGLYVYVVRKGAGAAAGKMILLRRGKDAR